MPKRVDIDVTDQKKAHREALEALSEVLSEVSTEAKALAKVAARGRAVDLTSLYALLRSMQQAEENCDITALDIQTALGEDA